MKRTFYDLKQGEKFAIYDGEEQSRITLIKCESGVTIDDGLTEVNAVNLTNGEFWTIGERVEVEV